MSEDDQSDVTKRRVWIGNLDPRVTEGRILRIASKYGKPVREQFICTAGKFEGGKVGPPRVFAFVDYSTDEEAQQAIKMLSGRQLLGRPIIIRLASDKPAEQMVSDKATEDKEDESELDIVKQLLKTQRLIAETERKIEAARNPKSTFICQSSSESTKQEIPPTHSHGPVRSSKSIDSRHRPYPSGSASGGGSRSFDNKSKSYGHHNSSRSYR